MATTSTGGQPVCPNTKVDKPGYALVIAHYLDPTTNIRSFFIGQESVYKPDSKTKKSFRSIPSTQTTNAARIAFAQKNTDFVSGTTKVVLRLKPGTTDEYKYTIQEVPSDPFHGFPKGAGLTKDEKGIDIAKREFKEETGYVLPRDPVYKRCIEFTATDNSGNKIPTVCVVFHYEVVDDKEKNAIEKAFSYKTVQGIGEMFNAAFKTAAEINATSMKKNYLSSTAFSFFAADHAATVDQSSIPKGGEKAPPPPAPAAYVPPHRKQGSTSANPVNTSSSRPKGPTANNKFAAFRRPGGGARRRMTLRRSRRQQKQSRRINK